MKDNPFKEIAATLDDQMQKRAGGEINGRWAMHELGTIVAGMGLKLDNFGPVIYGYMVNRILTDGEPYVTNTETVSGGSGDAAYAPHSHPVITPEQQLPLHVGDRVLVAPVDNGQNFVVECVGVPGPGGA